MGIASLDFLYLTRIGSGFQLQKRIELDANETKYFVLTLNSLDEEKTPYGMPIQAGTTNGLVYLDTYSADTYTAGTLLETINLNEILDYTSYASFYEGGTIEGQSYLREYTIGSESTNQTAGGGFITNDQPKILVRRPLVFEFTNQESSANVVTFGYVWYER